VGIQQKVMVVWGERMEGVVKVKNKRVGKGLRLNCFKGGEGVR
jgi:hypothetical protein